MTFRAIFRASNYLNEIDFIKIKIKHFIPVDTTFNDGKSCYRTCVDGEEPMDCFYEFHVQFYDTMNR